MEICEEIRKRRCGVVHCAVGKGTESLADAAKSFGLGYKSSWYREIDENTARKIAEGILHKDLAYNYQIIPLEEARQLASRFFKECCVPGCKFYTNGDYDGRRLSSWAPVTSATFDTGVIIISPTRTACLWVEDED